MTKYLVTWLGHDSKYYPEVKKAIVSENRLFEYTGLPEVKYYTIQEVDASKIIDKQKNDKAREERNKQLAKEAALAKLSPAERKLLKV